jgi:hypothetical protein
MIRWVSRLLPILIVLVAGTAAAADWQTYRNARFGFAVEYPADLLQMQPAPANDDGRAFRAPGRRIDVTASASHNVLDDTIGQLYAKALARYGPETVSYKRRGGDFFVVSGIRGGRVYYEYVQIARKHGGEYVGRLVLRYPPEEKPVMDPVVTRMQKRFSTSFRQMPPGG